MYICVIDSERYSQRRISYKMNKLLWTLFLGAFVVLVQGGRLRRQADGVCQDYCDVTPDDRDLCPETPETRPPNRVDTTQNLVDLRGVMANTGQTGAAGPLAAYLIYEGSYYGGGVSAHDRRMQWTTGFSGSSGHVVVTSGISPTTPRAALWTDGRYWIQGDQELDCNWIMMKSGFTGTPTSIQWLVDILPDNSLVGAHPDYMETTTWQEYETAFSQSGKNIQLVEVTQDLLAYIWDDTNGRPPISNNPIYEHTIDFAGKTWLTKLGGIRADINGKSDIYIATLYDDIAWTFNLRGSDREVSPLFDSFAFITQNEVRLYLRNFQTLLTADIQAHLNTGADGSCGGQTGVCVEIREYTDALADIAVLNSDPSITSVWINIGVSYAVYKAAGAKRVEDYSPIQLPKSQKNPTEVAKYRECQIRDSAHVVEFLAMLEREILAGNEWTELSASDSLLNDYRARDPNFRMLSFEAISASGPNGAVIHYAPAESTNRLLTTDEMYLLDSGGNYLDGTTDVTRTMHYGTPSAVEIEAYTRVLMGVIDLATTVWPFGWKGSDIDARTRTPLWQNGWDYNHGTGHGIGFFLNTHEGPGRINIGYQESAAILHEHMFFSDEPGYYEPGQYGIRLETIVEVVKANTPNNFNGKDYLTFDPVTFVPFEPKLIDSNLLEVRHAVWLNSYHAKCLLETGNYIMSTTGNQEAYDWIVARTAPLRQTPMGSGATTVSGQITACVAALSVVLSLVL